MSEAVVSLTARRDAALLAELRNSPNADAELGDFLAIKVMSGPTPAQAAPCWTLYPITVVTAGGFVIAVGLRGGGEGIDPFAMAIDDGLVLVQASQLKDPSAVRDALCWRRFADFADLRLALAEWRL